MWAPWHLRQPVITPWNVVEPTRALRVWKTIVWTILFSVCLSDDVHLSSLTLLTKVISLSQRDQIADYRFWLSELHFSNFCFLFHSKGPGAAFKCDSEDDRSQDTTEQQHSPSLARYITSCGTHTTQKSPTSGRQRWWWMEGEKAGEKAIGRA